MNENTFWDKFEEIEIIKEEEYGDLLQAKNKNTQKYIIIKRIDKSKYMMILIKLEIIINLLILILKIV